MATMGPSPMSLPLSRQTLVTHSAIHYILHHGLRAMYAMDACMEILPFLTDFDYYPMHFWEKTFGKMRISQQHNFGIYDFHVVFTTTILENYWSPTFWPVSHPESSDRNFSVFHLTMFSLDQAFSFTMRGFAGGVLLHLLGVRDVSAFMLIAARRSDETIVI